MAGQISKPCSSILIATLHNNAALHQQCTKGGVRIALKVNFMARNRKEKIYYASSLDIVFQWTMVLLLEKRQQWERNVWSTHQRSWTKISSQYFQRTTGKSAENRIDRQTDRQTERKPIAPSGFNGIGANKDNLSQNWPKSAAVKWLKIGCSNPGCTHKCAFTLTMVYMCRVWHRLERDARPIATHDVDAVQKSKIIWICQSECIVALAHGPKHY